MNRVAEETLFGDLACYTGTQVYTVLDCDNRAGARMAQPSATPSAQDARGLLEQLRAVYERAREKDWDGEQSLPVDGPTKEWGRKFAASIPETVPRPEVSIDRKGHVNFDWENGDDLVAAIVEARGVVYFISFIGGNRSRGRINDFSSQFPRPLLEQIRLMLRA